MSTTNRKCGESHEYLHGISNIFGSLKTQRIQKKTHQEQQNKFMIRVKDLRAKPKRG